MNVKGEATTSFIFTLDRGNRRCLLNSSTILWGALWSKRLFCKAANCKHNTTFAIVDFCMETIVQLPDTGRIHDPPAQPLVHSGQAYPQPTAQELAVPEGDIGKPGLAVLESLSVFYCLTAEQLTRLLYSKGSDAFVRRHLGLLKKHSSLRTCCQKNRFALAPRHSFTG